MTPITWTFAYGSNLDPDRLAARGVKPPRVRPAVLAGWELSFDMVGTPPGDPCYATLRPAPADVCVHGVLLALTTEEEATLLRSELTSRADDSPGYALTPVRPRTYDGEAVDAIALVARPARLVEGMVPSRRYVGLLRQGAAHHGLDPDYRAYLDHLPSMRPGRAQPALRGACLLALAPALVPAVLAWRLLGRPGPLAHLLRAVGPPLASVCARLPGALVGEPERVDGLDWSGLADRWPRFRTARPALWRDR